MNYRAARAILSEAAKMKYAQDAIPAVPELYMLTYSGGKSEGGKRKFVGKMRKNPSMVYEGAVKSSMEDWLADLPRRTVAELKLKHGRELKHTGSEHGYRDIGTKKTAELHNSIKNILQKHDVPKLLGSHNEGSKAIQMSFHTFHGDMNEAAPDVGQNLKGMPRKAGRKLAYALKGWGKGKIGNKEYEVAAARHTRRMGSQSKRWGKKLEKSLSDFSARTGIKLK
jgi:hypothetical protein